MKELLEALSKGDVRITFQSLLSRKQIKGVYTLKNTNFPQNPASNKLIVRHADSGMIEDIEKSTIIGWSRVSGESE